MSSIIKVLKILWNFDQSRLYLPVELKSLIVIFCLLLLHCKNKLDTAVGARPLLLCTFPMQVVEYFYHGQKMTYLFPREYQTKKYCLHRQIFLNALSRKQFIINLSSMKHPHKWETIFKLRFKLYLNKNSPFLKGWNLKGTLMQIWKSPYVCDHVKIIPWKFCILDPRNSQVIYL